MVTEVITETRSRPGGILQIVDELARSTPNASRSSDTEMGSIEGRVAVGDTIWIWTPKIKGEIEYWLANVACWHPQHFGTSSVAVSSPTIDYIDAFWLPPTPSFEEVHYPPTPTTYRLVPRPKTLHIKASPGPFKAD